MADGDLNLSRRALLGVAFAAPVLGRVEGPVLASGLPGHAELVSASSPPPAGRTARWTLKQVQGDGVGEWRRALAAFRRAEAALAAAARTPDEDLYDRLGARFDRAFARLLHAPAPDVAALALKLDLAFHEEAGEFAGDPAAIRALKQDARRLARG